MPGMEDYFQEPIASENNASAQSGCILKKSVV